MKRSEFLVRAARPADRLEWVRMRHALWPDCSRERHALEIRELTSARNRGVVLVAAQKNGDLIGFIEISLRADHVEGTSVAPVPYVEGWYVDLKQRGRGLGRRLVEAAEGWALEHGFRELASDAEIKNDEGIRAHVALGFTEVARTVHFVKAIARRRDHPSATRARSKRTASKN